MKRTLILLLLTACSSAEVIEADGVDCSTLADNDLPEVAFIFEHDVNVFRPVAKVPLWLGLPNSQGVPMRLTLCDVTFDIEPTSEQIFIDDADVLHILHSPPDHYLLTANIDRGRQLVRQTIIVETGGVPMPLD